MGMHLIERRIFDVDGNILTGLHLLPRGLNPAGQLGNLGLRVRHLFLRFHHLSFKVSHQLLPFRQSLGVDMGNVTPIYIHLDLHLPKVLQMGTAKGRGKAGQVGKSVP